MSIRFLAILLGMAFTSLQAGVSPDKAERLRGELTPLGAERSGNADGSIPAWQGGLRAPPPCYKKGARYCDPFPQDKPITVITAANLDAWRDKLADGQIDLMLRHPDTYKVPLYPTRRSFANPPKIYEAAYQNALNAILMPSGREIRDASIAVPFPIPEEGVAPIWNHRLRYRGPGFRRWYSRASVTGSGNLSLFRLREDASFPYALGEVGKKSVAQRWLHAVLEPERLRGAMTLIHDTLDNEDRPAQSWQQSSDARYIHRKRSFGFDHAAMASDDLLMDDQIDTWFGTPERYTWRILAKRDMVMPYNSYALHAQRTSLRDLIKPGHVDPSQARYEMHRVWIVEANTKPSAVHRSKRRRFYIDEDSWQILMVDVYDQQGKLWRWQEVHTLMAYDHQALVPAVEVIYDLNSSRYLVQGIDEGDEERVEINFDENDFSPSGARAQMPR
tara:strand:- start:4032 stop:5369 length:1338 start_codon:yes stop_codon:yes gene_type:complete